jgi:hypothetical protein
LYAMYGHVVCNQSYIMLHELDYKPHIIWVVYGCAEASGISFFKKRKRRTSLVKMHETRSPEEIEPRELFPRCNGYTYEAFEMKL